MPGASCSPAAAERTVLGAGVWLALGRPWARMAVTSGVQGYAETAIPLPPAGSQLAAQYLFENTSACGGPGAWSASNAVVLTVQ